MPNHFHFLVQIKSEKELFYFSGFEKTEGVPKIPSDNFGKLFNSYAKAYNREQNRLGSLFMKNFKRKLVKDELYLKKLVHYIHNNPVKANMCQRPEDYLYSSYKDIITNTITFIKRDELISWFNDLDNFIYFHSLSPELKEFE